ncbi:rod shape-determining protein RodA [bacterium]|nr:rod shape-determining protein RodA [bacterium]
MGLFVSMVLAFLLGIFTLYSASKGAGVMLYKTQMVWWGIGLCLGLVLFFIDSHIFEKLAYPFYGMCLFLLTIVLFIGRVGGGSQRWIDLKFFHLQPSEIAKLAIVFTLAKYFSDDQNTPPYTLRTLLVPGLLVAPFFLLILLQPDLGTAGVLFLVSGSMVFFLRVAWQSLMLVGLAALIAVPLAYQFVLHDYQRDRVKTFVNPGRDARGSGYNALQCKIAVGSGKVVGKGFLKGTQSQLNFIPEQHTDFIFSVFSEERGFLGAMVLLALYWSYLFYSLRTVARARDKFEMLLAFGLTAIIFWHVFINIGMVIGILPIVGVGLPFFSYGGSSMLTFMVATALLLNLSRKKYIF